jgi:hypothetical protein
VENGIRVVIPKFGNGRIARFFARFAVQTEDKVNLDEFGSLVYRACDGMHTVADIGGQLREHFGTRAEPLEPRLALFMQELFKRNLITFTPHE